MNPSAMMERVEVLEGGQVLYYGTQAAAGSVKIVSKSFSPTIPMVRSP
jgi:vitamin B12 transporter